MLTTIVEAVLDTEDVTEVVSGMLVVEGATVIGVDAMLVTGDGTLIDVVCENDVVVIAEVSLSD